MAVLEISGNLRDRFIQAAVLLHALDNVRGEPTGHGIDQDAVDIAGSRERMLKRKFLESFALVCATRKGGDTVSAACMEEGAPEGTVIRVASNSGVTADVLAQLRAIMDVLNRVVSQVADVNTSETDVLLRIIRLDITKLRAYIKNLRTTKDIFDEPIAALESRFVRTSSSAPHRDLQTFLDWFKHIFEIRDLPVSPEPEILIPVVRWAQKARKDHLDYLKDAFSTKNEVLPKWIRTVFKIGRYGIASRALVQLASEFPALFNPMIVEPVAAPLTTKFVPLSDKICLKLVLRRVLGDRGEEYIPRLASIWGTADASGHFRSACTLNLKVHAEMQLVGFYDHNRQSKPSMRFMGVSKKSCYLCHSFLANHPESLQVSACHQKLYLSWFPSPALDRSIYIRYKAIITELSKMMEATAKRELETRLGSLRRPAPSESTAGISLSGLTEIGSPQIRASEAIDLRSGHIVDNDAATGGHAVLRRSLEPEQPFQQIRTIELTGSSQEIDTIDEIEMAATSVSFVDDRESSSSSSMMVFHFMRADNARRQDIVSTGDIFDHLTGRPSWTKLVNILKTKGRFGVAFNENDEVLMIENRICVSNERQFLACLQYLRNSSTLNVEALVYGVNDAQGSTY